MANQEQPIVNDWATVSLGFPDELRNLGASVDGVANALIAGLNIALTVLDVLKTFSVGYLDPIQALVDAVVGEIEKFIADLDQIGLYIAGDWGLFSYPFDDLRGGYQAYERRMISRLTDATDPSRPNVTEATTVFGAFLYLSVEAVDQIKRLWSFLKEFSKLFKVEVNSKSLPTPINLNARYGTEALTIFDFKNIKDYYTTNQRPPSKINLQWNISAASAKTPFIPFPLPLPGGFLVEVSTVQDGLKIQYERPASDSPTVNGKNGEKVQLKEYGSVLDQKGKPLVIYGGLDSLDITDDLQYNSQVDSNGNLKKGGRRVFGIRNQTDTVPIPLDKLKDGDKYLLQRTFYLSKSELTTSSLFTPGDAFQITLDKKDLPYNAEYKINNGKVEASVKEQPSEYFVRIASVSEDIKSKDDFRYSLAPVDIDVAGKPVKAIPANTNKGVPVNLGSDKGELSNPLKVILPNENTFDFIDSLTTALVVLYLSRSDLPLVEDQFNAGKIPLGLYQSMIDGKAESLPADTGFGATGLEEVAKKILPFMYSDIRKEFDQHRVGIVEFRKKLLRTAKKHAALLYKKLGPNSILEKKIAKATEKLRTWKWSDTKRLASEKEYFPNETILQSLSSTFTDGVALNCFNIEIPEEIVNRDFFKTENNIFHSRTPGYLETVKINPNDGFKSVMTQSEVDSVLKENPNYLSLFRRFRKKEEGKIIYRIPDLFLGETYQWGSSDNSPILVFNQIGQKELGKGCRLYFCRNVIDFDIYEASATILNVAASALSRPQKDGEWVALRLFTGLPEIEQFMKQIENWLKTTKQGVKSISDAIKSFIDFLQARILEIQNLIRKIAALLNVALNFNLESVSALLTISKGTQGVLADFVGASDKPNDPKTAYGAGVVILAPSAPSFVIDLFRQIK